jgi:hypothetical protein
MRPTSSGEPKLRRVRAAGAPARPRRRRRCRLVAVPAALAAGLGLLGTHLPGSSSEAADRPALSAAASGCGATRIVHGAVPAWAAPAFADSSSRTPPWPHAVSARGNAVAVVFGYPLRAGHPMNPANKILWIMRLPRNGSPLTITAKPLHRSSRAVRSVWPADSSPGEIYPSYVNVPGPGCWKLSLRWAGHTDSIDLPYRPASPA